MLKNDIAGNAWKIVNVFVQNTIDFSPAVSAVVELRVLADITHFYSVLEYSGMWNPVAILIIMSIQKCNLQ